MIDVPVLFLSEELEKEQFKYYPLLNGVRAIKGKQADFSYKQLFEWQKVSFSFLHPVTTVKDIQKFTGLSPSTDD